MVQALKTALTKPAPQPQATLVIYRKGFTSEPVARLPLVVGDDGMSYADARDLAKAMGITSTATGKVGVVAFMQGYSLQWDKPANLLIAVEKYVLVIKRKNGTKTTLPLDIRADGMSWADAKKMATAAGITTTQTGAAKVVDFLQNYHLEWDKEARELRATENGPAMR